ncbi:MAG: hypothetical protein KJO57_13975, partial [Deltaproteobacteria bacterium]|nr:hypothetical protein [Deltaproteobacteria bacterium]
MLRSIPRVDSGENPHQCSNRVDVNLLLLEYLLFCNLPKRVYLVYEPIFTAGRALEPNENVKLERDVAEQCPWQHEK